MRRLCMLIAACAVMYLVIAQPIPALAAANITSLSPGCTGVTVNFTVTTTGAGSFNIIVRDNTNTVVGTLFGGTSGAGTFGFSRFIFINPTLIDGTPLTVSVTVSPPNSGADSRGPIACTGGIIPPSPSAPSEAEFVSAPIINDGRINPGKGDMNAVIYETEQGGIEVYDVGDSGTGFLVISVTDEALAGYPEKPGENTLISSSADGKTALYKLTTGEYQVNTGPDGEGKVTNIIFTGRDNVYLREYNVHD